ncbi:hypothetical protein ACM55G_01110 [Flavobacterium sp. LB3P122]|uniref:hypothetical protein n=1 Tax=Flavobacterium TaxID=237 RepID=UPI003A89D121
MTDITQFFLPFFSSVLFNHSNLALIELSFFTSILMFGTVGKLVNQKPETSFASIGYLVSVSLFLSAGYLAFHELTWWKSTINIIVSTIVFLIVSELILFVFILLFSGLYNYNHQSSKNEITLKRSAALFIATITIIAIALSVLLEKQIF